jgi:hypothetical protein
VNLGRDQPSVFYCCCLQQDAEYDSDGDLVVARRGAAREAVLRVEHLLATPLQGVGRQVWRGSLLLADYLLHHHIQVPANCDPIHHCSGSVMFIRDPNFFHPISEFLRPECRIRIKNLRYFNLKKLFLSALGNMIRVVLPGSGC